MAFPERVRATGGAVLACVLLLTGTDAALADPVPVQTVARGQTAGLSGSERLRTFAWGKWLDTGQAPREIVAAMRSALTRQGFYHDGEAPALVWTDARAAPLLGYETNVNGGVAQDSFTFGAYVFEAVPEVRAVPGIVLGIDGSGLARFAWDTGRTLEVAASGTFGWAPQSDHSFRRGTVQLCSRNHVVRWIFLDACLLQAVSARDLASSSIDRASLTLSKLFEAPSAWHELSGELATTRTGTYEQTTGSIALGSVWDHAVTDASFTLGAPVDGITALDYRLAFDIRWLAGGHPTAIGFWTSASSGGNFLGVERVDEASGITASWQATSGLTAEIGYARVNSTADLYDDESVTFRLRVDDWRF